MEIDSSEHVKHTRAAHFGLIVVCATLIVISQREGPSQFIRARKDFIALSTSLQHSLSFEKLYPYLDSIYKSYPQYGHRPGSNYQIALISKNNGGADQVTCYKFEAYAPRSGREYSIFKSVSGKLTPRDFMQSLLLETGFSRPSADKIVISPFQVGRFQRIYRQLRIGQEWDHHFNTIDEMKALWNDLDNWNMHIPLALGAELLAYELKDDGSYDLRQAIVLDAMKPRQIDFSYTPQCPSGDKNEQLSRGEVGIGTIKNTDGTFDRRLVWVEDSAGGYQKGSPRITLFRDVRSETVPISLRSLVISNGLGIGAWSDGPFDAVFPDLDDVSKHLGSITPDEFKRYLDQQVSKERGETSIFGISAPTSLAASLGPYLLIFVQIYFWLNLRLMLSRKRLSPDDRAWSIVPWIALSDDPLCRISLVITAVIAPVGLIVFLGWQSVVPMARATPLMFALGALLSASVSSLTGLSIRVLWKKQGEARRGVGQRASKK